MDKKRIAERIARDMTAGDLYLDSLVKAQEAIQYTPVQYGWDDPGMQRAMAQKKKEIVKALEEMIDLYPAKVTYTVVGFEKVLKFNSEDDLIAAMKREGIRHTGYNTNYRVKKVLHDQPTFDGLVGPMADRAKVVRYETSEANRMLSI